MAALVLMLMVPVCVGVLVGVSAGRMLVLLPVMAVGTTFVAMLVLMLVFVIATHRGISSPSYHFTIKISILPLAVNGSSASTRIQRPSHLNFSFIRDMFQE